jgi:hypothetical protein
MPNNKKRPKSKPKRVSAYNNFKKISKKEDQKALKVLLGKKKLSLSDTAKRGYPYKKDDARDIEFKMFGIPDSSDVQRNLVRQFQSVKEEIQGIFKCAIHKFGTDYYNEWGKHLVDKKHSFSGTMMCRKCNKPKVIKDFPITKMAFKKAVRVRCDKCKKYLMIKMIRDSWGMVYPQVVG